MRIAIGGFAQESHSFSPVPGSWAHFGPQEILRGADILAETEGTQTEIGGALRVAKKRGVELVPLLCARASSSTGPMVRQVFETIRDELLQRLQSESDIDGVLLILHGAMVVDGYDDGTGEILRAVRAQIGPRMPLVGTLDLHANVTERMHAEATALVGFHTAPHVDLYETGQRGMRLLVETIAGQARPVSALRRLPMFLPGETARTDAGPLSQVMAQAEEVMARPDILDVSIFSVQPWLDVPNVGCAVLVIADGNRAVAEEQADRLADSFWARRHEFKVDLVPTRQAIERALSSDRHPFILADSADAPSSGAPGDSTAVLRALLEAKPAKDCYLNIVDPPAVEAMIQAGVGQEATVTLGARFAPAFYSPVEIAGYVKLISDGDFVQKGPGFRGAICRRGRTVVLRIGHIYLVVMERPCRQWDPELYRSVGLEPADAQIVVVKSPAAFRAAYGPLAAEIMILDTPGVCSPDLRSFPWKRVRRPLYPLDDPSDWRG